MINVEETTQLIIPLIKDAGLRGTILLKFQKVSINNLKSSNYWLYIAFSKGFQFNFKDLRNPEIENWEALKRNLLYRDLKEHSIKELALKVDPIVSQLFFPDVRRRPEQEGSCFTYHYVVINLNTNFYRLDLTMNEYYEKLDLLP